MKRVLLLLQDPEQRRQLTELLKSQHRVLAVERSSAVNLEFDVGVVDREGLARTGAAWGKKRHQKTCPPLLLVPSESQAELPEGFRAGVDAVAGYPLNIDELSEQLAALVDRRAPRKKAGVRGSARQRRASRHAAKGLTQAARLARAVARDLNDLLTVIAGHSQLLRAHQSTDPRSRHSLDQIRQTVQRATTLTCQLLEFGALSAVLLSQAERGKGRRRRATILLIEGRPLVRLLLGLHLRAHGHRVLEAQDGAEAALLAHQRAAQLDLVIVAAEVESDLDSLAHAVSQQQTAVKVLCLGAGTPDHAFPTPPFGPVTLVEGPVTAEWLLTQVQRVLQSEPEMALPRLPDSSAP